MARDIKVGIVYFSQTGNTRLVAKVIRTGIEELLGGCSLLKLEEIEPAVVSDYDLIGLGLPSFYFREPANVARFFREMPGQAFGGRSKPFFFFVTHGGTPVDTFDRVHRLASGRGLETVGFFECLGVDTYPPFAERKPLTALGHPDQADLERARIFAGTVLDNTRAYGEGRRWPGPSIPGSFWTRLAAAPFGRRGLEVMLRLRMLPAKRVRTDRCARCGWCVRNCPSGVIRLNPFPWFAVRGCIACYHCQRGCPAGAISCDWRMFKLISGEFLRRRHCKINGKSIINQEPTNAGKGTK